MMLVQHSPRDEQAKKNEGMQKDGVNRATEYEMEGHCPF
jgi:hypothetical protein